MSLRVAEDRSVTVRAPYGLAASEADRFVENHREWILSRFQEYEKLRRLRPVYGEEERKAGKAAAKRILEEKCRRYSKVLGVTYGTVSVREQKTRWGSCSARGNLSFNWKLALMPEEIQDYLVVHELAHRLQMNHGPEFWAVVAGVIPDYKERRNWLKKNGMYY